jgi:hypothetical protein
VPTATVCDLYGDAGRGQARSPGCSVRRWEYMRDELAKPLPCIQLSSEAFRQSTKRGGGQLELLEGPKLLGAAWAS